MHELLVATTNKGKLREYQAMLATLDSPIRWYTLNDVGLDQLDVEETGDTFLANALLKGQVYCARSGLPTLADDSGIVVDALNGGPGVYSARYAPTSAERNAKLLAALKDVPPEKRTARFVCVTALVLPTGITITAEGVVEGSVGYELRGSNGFGYDPLFLLPDGRTTAEIPAEEKNVISHRGRALNKLEPYLRFAFGPRG